MTEQRQPPRLVDSFDVPADLRSALGRAHSAGPSTEEIEQLVRAVEGSLVASAAAGASAGLGLASRSLPAQGAGLRMVAWAKWLLPLVALGGAGLAARPWLRSGGDTENGAARALHEPPAPPGQPSIRREPPRSAAVEVTQAESAPDDGIETAAAGSTPPARSGEPRNAEARAASSALAGNPEHEGTPDRQLDEYQLLRRARAALAGDPAAALRLAEEHAQRFNRGLLAQEREAITIEALSRLGRVAEARMRAERFLKQYPNTPYRKRLEAFGSPQRGRSAR